jgi:hypothetical protein
MRKYISPYIDSYTFGSRKAVSDLIISAKKDKRSLGNLAKNLSAMSSLNSYNGLYIKPYNLVSLEAIIDFFRDINIKTRQYFDSLNTVTYSMNSYSNVMHSEIAKLEKNIQELQIYADNFAFISGEDDLFNGSFVETFSDDTNSYINEGGALKLKDRDGSFFDESKICNVDVIAGTLKNGASFKKLDINPIVKSYINNYSNYISSASSIEDIFSEKANKAWNVTIKSPRVISDSITGLQDKIGYSYPGISGAQASILIEFSNPQEMNCIRISPNIGIDFQILQVIVNSPNDLVLNSSSSKGRILESPLLIDSTKDISFSHSTVNSIELVINQPTYRKLDRRAAAAEMQARTLNDYIKSLRDKRVNKHDKLQDLVYSYFNTRNQTSYLNTNNKYTPNNYSYRYPCDDTEPIYGSLSSFLEGKKSFVQMDMENRFNSADQLTNLVESVVSHVLGGKFRMSPSAYLSVKGNDDPLSISDIQHNGFMHVGTPQGPHSQSVQDQENLMDMADRFDLAKSSYSLDNIGSYEYSFSIKSLKFGLIQNVSILNANQLNSSSQSLMGNGLSESKGYYVSKKINSGGFINQVKLKSEYFIPKSLNQLLDLKDTASIEFSVTTKNIPTEESDWIPILPYGSTDVSAEVLYPNTGTGLCTMRFFAKANSIKLYKNGILLSDNAFRLSDSDNIKTIQIINPDASGVYVASYSTAASFKDPNLIDFSQLSINNFYLRSYSDQYGLGETLSTQGIENRAILSSDPYIDYSKFDGYVYSGNSGTIGYDPNSNYSEYSPISVILEDGTPAINLTNYLSNKYIKYSNPSNSGTTTYYIQTGKTLAFSKKTTNFKAYYDYIPESLRYKVVIRTLDPAVPNSAFVDNLILKFQMKNTDQFVNKLLKVI